LKTIFTIGNNNSTCDVLLLEIGEDYCCYALLKGEERAFYHVKYLTYDRLEVKEELAKILDDIRSENCEKVFVCCAFSESILVPQRFTDSNEIFLNVLFDRGSKKHFTDAIPEWQINAVYSLPSAVYDLVMEKFPSAKFFHAYTPSLKIYNGFVASDQIDIHFSTQHFRVVVKKDKQVQLAQTYSYKNPLDVVYYLLKICYEFQLNQSEVFIIVSGLIEQDSAMYTELHNYFLHLHFAQAPAYRLPENDHPHYYFTSLYNLAACVS
jgi:hypothetical protein